MSVLAIDFGFGNIKWCTDNKKGIFRSAFSKMGPGTSVLIGGDAIKTGRVLQAQTVDDLIKLYPLVISRLINDNHLSYPDIAVGLPLQSWQNLQIRTELADVISLAIKDIGKVYIYPQAAAVALVMGDGLVIDIGHNTVIACIVKDSKIVYEKTYYRRGAMDIALQLNKILQNELSKIGRTFTTVELDEILLQKKLQLGLEVYDLTAEVDAIKTAYIKETISLVINDIKASAGVTSFDTLYLIGGLAKDVNIQSSKVKIVIPDDPIFANVDAFYQLASLTVVLS